MAMTAEKGPEEVDGPPAAVDDLPSVGVAGASEVSRLTRFADDINDGAALDDWI